MRAIYLAFISIVLLSIVLAGWTSYAFIFQSSKSSQITEIIKDIYVSQKSLVIDFMDLSKILIEDKSKNLVIQNDNIDIDKELSKEVEDNSQLEESLKTEDTRDNYQLEESLKTEDTRDNYQIEESLKTKDNGDNPLGIVIEPSKVSPELLGDEEKEVLMNDMIVDY